MTREFVCIVCPSGCLLSIDDGDNSLHVTGNSCEQGFGFAEKEVYDPERILTTTVKLSDGGLLPVRSNAMVKKREVRTLVKNLKSVVVTPPVVIGQIIVSGVGENAVDIVATDNNGAGNGSRTHL